jgi:hypothetical protein
MDEQDRDSLALGQRRECGGQTWLDARSFFHRWLRKRDRASLAPMPTS